ncbi:hypothetical protein [Antribacter gilvus]|uniref:hypothetical protein n=1 Tax=Antribacter gilvus TaxID=2304675 RepID=UPI000F7B560A|nr:hypothetical protein [Antribacter gilvus]
MAARTREWHLVGYDRDPVPSEGSALDDVIQYYGKLADMMSTEARVLKQIGDGDTTLLQGVSADAMRKRAGESHDALRKAADRYEQMQAALVEYQPELAHARSETGFAVKDAEDAVAAQRTADGMPDPRPEGEEPLTPEEEKQSAARGTALEGAAEALAKAKERARVAMERFDGAARRAADAIRKDWHTDGLHASGWDKFVHGFNKFLKGLVEILGYIGLALAVLSVLIPGVGFLTVTALVAGAISVVANIILAAQGEGSWLAVALGIVGLGLYAFSAFATRAATKGLLGVHGAARSGMVDEIAHLRLLRNWAPQFQRSTGYQQFRNVPHLDARLGRLDDLSAFLKKNPVKPEWFRTRHPDYLKFDRARFADPRGNWRIDKVFGVDRAVDWKTWSAGVSKILPSVGPMGGPTAWMYAGGFSQKLAGWSFAGFGIGGTPSYLNSLAGRPDLRSGTLLTDANYAGFYSGQNL